jgi:hypothetical protein
MCFAKIQKGVVEDHTCPGSLPMQPHLQEVEEDDSILSYGQWMERILEATWGLGSFKRDKTEV